ncbi:MAG: BadF/BadG/BcrA/BcrD ATPase family protein [Eubacteriales bacterium]
MKSKKGVYIGVDGGGTKAAFCLSINGETSYHKIDKSVNPNDVGYESSYQTIVSGITEVLAKNPLSVSPDSVFVGVAGGSDKLYREFLTQSLAHAFPKAVIGVSHDGENILYAAFPDCDGAIIICGTGSSCFVKTGESVFRIGGYSVFDLDGNGYEMGKRAISHALKCVDGREREGILCKKIKEFCGGDCLLDLERLLKLPVTQIAALAKLVFESASLGDQYAEGIIESSAKYLAGYVARAGEFFNSDFNVCVAGGVGTNPYMLKKLKAAISNPRANVFPLKKDPVLGALYKAALQAKKS